MLKIEDKMIELLKNGAYFSKLKDKTGLFPSDLVGKMRGLEEKGYLIDRVFNEYGVKYQIVDSFIKPLQDNIEFNIGGQFNFLVIADTHFGNIYEDMELVYKCYQYAENNGIRYIFHLGDMIEGVALENHTNDRIKRLSVHEQLDYVTRNYPRSDKITTLYILGNHDYRCISKGIDVSRVLERRRMDLHFLGYQNSKIRIGNRDILLHHPFTIDKQNKYDNEIKDIYINADFDLILRGHTHHNGIYINDMGSLVVNVPACYNSPSRAYNSIYEVSLREDEIKIDNLIIENFPVLFSRLEYPLKKKETEKTKQLVKTPQSPIEKFNERLSKMKK